MVTERTRHLPLELLPVSQLNNPQVEEAEMDQVPGPGVAEVASVEGEPRGTPLGPQDL